MSRISTPLSLSRKLACFLASMEGAAPEAIEATVALLPLGSRISLAINGIIDTEPDQAAANRGETTDFSLTEKGLEVIRECARWQEQDEEEQLKRRRAEVEVELHGLAQRQVELVEELQRLS